MYPYIIQSSVTDINWNGKQLWIDDLEQGRYMAPEILSDCFVERFIMLLSNITCVTFNRINPVMEAETEELRVSVVYHIHPQNTGSVPDEQGKYDPKWLLQ